MPILLGDCREVLKTLPDSSVHCVVTSPPYWGLRDYGTATWEGGDAECDHRAPDEAGKTDKPTSGQREHAGRFAGPICHKCGARRIDSQLGLEPTPEAYVANMVGVFREVRRVLREDGTCWLNLGDSYNAGRDGGHAGGKGALNTGRNLDEIYQGRSGANAPGLKPKDLCGIPWRVAFALQADGWWLRQDIIWHKPNPMPESVTDRCTKAHEYVFLLTKAARYYYDAEAVKEKVGEETRRAATFRNGGDYTGGNSFDNSRKKEKDSHGDGATELSGRNKRSVWTVATQPYAEAHFATFPPDLIKPMILAGCPVGGTVLDPFGGSGTTGQVAEDLGRKWILIELNENYSKLAEDRTAQMGLVL